MSNQIKTIPAKLKNFTPCMDVIVKNHGAITSIVYGRVWRYCQGENKVCIASIQKIADDLGLSYRTILTHLKILVENEYLYDLTPGMKNHPHKYMCSNKINIGITIDVLEENGTELNADQDNSTMQNIQSHSAFSAEPTMQNMQLKKEKKESNIIYDSFQEIARVFTEEKLGFLSPGIAGKIDVYLKDGVDPQWIIEAIRRAGYHEKRSWSYAEAILRSFIEKGCIDDGYKKDNNENSNSKKELVFEGMGFYG